MARKCKTCSGSGFIYNRRAYEGDERCPEECDNGMVGCWGDDCQEDAEDAFDGLCLSCERKQRAEDWEKGPHVHRYQPPLCAVEDCRDLQLMHGYKALGFCPRHAPPTDGVNEAIKLLNEALSAHGWADASKGIVLLVARAVGVLREGAEDRADPLLGHERA